MGDDVAVADAVELQPRQRQAALGAVVLLLAGEVQHRVDEVTDDVVDGFLSMLSNGKVTGDKVGPHGDLLDEFPYLGPPHA